MSQDESTLLNLFLEFFVSIYLVDVFVAVLQRLLVDVLLDFFQQVLYVFFDAFARTSFLFQRITTHDFHRVVFQVAATHYQTYRYTLQFIVCKLESRTLVVGVVVFHGDAHAAELVDNAFHLGVNLLQLLIVLIDRHYYYLNRSQVRWKYQTVVVGVSHDQGTHQAGRYPPRGSPYIIQLVVLVDELYVEGLGKVLSQEVRRTALQCLSVLHQSFDGIRIQGTGKTFVG